MMVVGGVRFILGDRSEEWAQGQQYYWMESNLNRFIRLNRRKTLKPPQQQCPKLSIDLEVKTWSKDTFALYDYHANQASFFREKLQIARDCHIYRNVNTQQTIIQFHSDSRPLPIEHVYIASLLFDPVRKSCVVQSAEGSGVQPSACVLREYPNIFKNSYLVVGEAEGSPLSIGSMLKLGRLEYQVIQIRDENGSETLKQTSHLEYNKGLHIVADPQDQNNQQQDLNCRICLGDENSETDPLINPCGCKGSCMYVHVGCIKNWIGSKVKQEIRGVVHSYNFTKFECEICKEMLPRAVRLLDGSEVNLIFFDKPDKPYLVLESVSDSRKEEPRERSLHVIFPSISRPLKIGRGNDCEIKISDISVSRNHAQITFNQHFCIRDLKSKFGTLVKFKESVQLNGKLLLQYGRACFDFHLHQEVKQEREASRAAPTEAAERKEKIKSGPPPSERQDI